MKKENIEKIVKEGDTMKASPRLTNEKEWVEGIVIDIEKNPYRGLIIAIKDKSGRIFFGEAEYFIFA